MLLTEFLIVVGNGSRASILSGAVAMIAKTSLVCIVGDINDKKRKRNKKI